MSTSSVLFFFLQSSKADTYDTVALLFMSGLSTGGGRGVQAKAPEKGVFPLDHFGECKEVGPDVTVPVFV